MTDFESFYHRYRNLMYRIAFDLLKNPQDAEDAVQEAFLNIADHFDKISGVENPQSRSFAAVVTRNICFNKLRKRKNTTGIDKIDQIDIEEAEIPDNKFSTEEEVLSQFGVETLENALTKLPQNYIDILYLTAYEDMSLKEAAQLLDITYENAKSRLQRGRKKLLKILEEEHYE